MARAPRGLHRRTFQVRTRAVAVRGIATSFSRMRPRRFRCLSINSPISYPSTREIDVSYRKPEMASSHLASDLKDTDMPPHGVNVHISYNKYDYQRRQPVLLRTSPTDSASLLSASALVTSFVTRSPLFLRVLFVVLIVVLHLRGEVFDRGRSTFRGNSFY